jgi:hypothetical protein
MRYVHKKCPRIIRTSTPKGPPVSVGKKNTMLSPSALPTPKVPPMSVGNSYLHLIPGPSPVPLFPTFIPPIPKVPPVSVGNNPNHRNPNPDPNPTPLPPPTTPASHTRSLLSTPDHRKRPAHHIDTNTTDRHPHPSKKAFTSLPDRAIQPKPQAGKRALSPSAPTRPQKRPPQKPPEKKDIH